jgi:hypothetical protein
LILQGLPQQYYDKDQEKIQWRVPYGTPRKIPQKSFIHASAIRRIKNSTPGPNFYQPKNLPIAHCHALEVFPANTTANLAGCWVYEPPLPPHGGKETQSEKLKRIGKLVVGWLTFALFWALVLAFAWYVVAALLFLLLFVLAVLITHTPGIHKLFRCLHHALMKGKLLH